MAITQVTKAFSVSGALSEQELLKLKAGGVTTLVNVRPDNESSDQVRDFDWRRTARDLGYEYMFIPVTSGKYALPDVTAFYDLLNDPERKTHAFCRTGTRALHLWALAQATKHPYSDLQSQCLSCGLDLSSIGEQVDFFHKQQPWQGMDI